MKSRLVMLVLFSTLSSTHAWAVEQHPARGIVLATAGSRRSLVVSCDAIPGYMDAMEMSFAVRDPRMLAPIKPGMAVNFNIVAREKNLYAESIHAATTASFESEPMEAAALTALHTMLDPQAAAKNLTVGEQVPDFTLTDQVQKQIRLSQFRGKVIALTFGYSRCPNPNYCFRLSNNLAHLESRFRDRAGRDLVLLTIAIDPEHDQGAALAEYANTWRADPKDWHFLTGPLAEVKQVAEMFGVNFWNSEGTLTHTLHTVIIDRKGQLAANIEGNHYTTEQLSDLVQTVMKRP